MSMITVTSNALRARLSAVAALTLTMILSHQAVAQIPVVHINENFGFNVPGYNYKQPEFPCSIDTELVTQLVKRGKKAGIEIVPVRTADKILNVEVPVLAIDIEQLVLGSEEHSYGGKTKSSLPKVKILVGLINGEEITSANHTCAIATLNEFSMSSSVLDMGSVTTVCGATRKCLRDLSKDVIKWLEPQVK